MRDIIWTLILIWLVYKIVGIFRGIGARNNTTYQTQREQSSNHSADEIKSALKKHANNEGEYIDYEEIK